MKGEKIYIYIKSHTFHYFDDPKSIKVDKNLKKILIFTTLDRKHHML